MDKIPGEFRYWQNREEPWAVALRQQWQKFFKIEPSLPDEQIRQFANSYYDADPVAERFIEEVYLPRGQSQGRAMVEQALAGGCSAVPDAPDSLRALFAEMEQRPSWLNEEQLALGAKVFRRFGTHMYSFAGAITLEGYRENSVAKPLAMTGAYTGESANRRFLETAAFWIDVSSPGALSFGAQGMKTALRVRLMHVFVRARLARHPSWNVDAWGVPISQGDALLTLMGGSFLPGFGLRLLGYRTSKEEILAMMHFWRYVGHLVGVQPRWYPTSIREALGLCYVAAVKGVRGSGDDGVGLAQSYLQSYAPRPGDALSTKLKKYWEHGIQRGYVSWFLPPQTHDFYRLPKAGLWWIHPLLQLPVVYLRETVRKNIEAVDAWWDEAAQQQTRSWLASHLGERSVEYRAVEQFTR